MSDYIFDDGSVSAKVLQHEIKAQVIQVKDGKLEDWLSLISEDGITKVYLHYCYEDYTPGLRAEIHSQLAKNPNLRIICHYENIPKSDIEKRVKEYGIEQKFKAVKHTEIASDVISPVATGGHEVPSEEFIEKLIEVRKWRPPEMGEIVDKTLEENKDKIKFIDYGKFTVGGNDSLRSQKARDDSFVKKSEEYKNKRRRKKKDVSN